MKILLINSLTPGHGSTYRSRLLWRSLIRLGHKVVYLESNSDLAQGVSIKQNSNVFSYILASLKRAYYCLFSKYDFCLIQKATPLTIFSILAVLVTSLCWHYVTLT